MGPMGPWAQKVVIQIQFFKKYRPTWAPWAQGLGPWAPWDPGPWAHIEKHALDPKSLNYFVVF